MEKSNTQFIGSIPRKYDEHLGPFIFEPNAADFVRRLTIPAGGKVLELACGTGILTRKLLEALPADGRLVATDLNEPMLAYARSRAKGDPRLEWRQADATALPFGDETFDRVASQFGVMFFPDKAAAFREARRVLKKGGELAFSVWDSLEANPSGKAVHQVVMKLFPENPPDFYSVPFGYFDRKVIRQTLETAGFGRIRIESVVLESKSHSARHTAIGLVEGNPLILALQERGVTDAGPIVDQVARVLGSGDTEAPVTTPMSAIWICGTREA